VAAALCRKSPSLETARDLGELVTANSEEVRLCSPEIRQPTRFSFSANPVSGQLRSADREFALGKPFATGQEDRGQPGPALYNLVTTVPTGELECRSGATTGASPNARIFQTVFAIISLHHFGEACMNGIRR